MTTIQAVSSGAQSPLSAIIEARVPLVFSDGSGKTIKFQTYENIRAKYPQIVDQTDQGVIVLKISQFQWQVLKNIWRQEESSFGNRSTQSRVNAKLYP